MSKEANKNKTQIPCSTLPRPVSLQDAENSDAVWETIIKRFPNTAPLLCEMEEVIDRAQSILLNFKSVSCPTEKEHLRFSNTSKNSDSIKRQSHIDANIPEFIVPKSDHKISKKGSHDSVSLHEWEEFSNNKGIDHLSYSSYFNDSTPIDISRLSINDSSTNSANGFGNEVKSTDSLNKMRALHEIKKVQSLSLNDQLEAYRDKISMTKCAIETIKSTEHLQKQMMDKNRNCESHIITIKEAILSPIPVEVSTYDDKVSSFKSYYNEDQTQQRQQKHEAENVDSFRSVKKRPDIPKKSPCIIDESLKK
ncbi:uncharacterized protein [Chelonus insularis]|uniref:uncharacterized protein isoform X2 n=1 Tax=Chelonus insularis TaxID=460826 RepID=UPI00158E03A9|nr:uncharacterized protein LOC118073261 isoform X2 [Chelonus insularis]